MNNYPSFYEDYKHFLLTGNKKWAFYEDYIHRWVGLSTTAPFSPSDHFTQFKLGGGGPHMRQSRLNVIWFATVWELWKEINNKIFKSKECSILQLVDKIKLLSFSWLKMKLHLSLNYHGWWLNPLAMLGYG